MKLIKALKGIISNDIGWKILSVFFAASMWFIVMNLNNPTETKAYTVNLTLLNEDKLTENDYTILNRSELEQTKVTIRVKASRSALDELNKKENRNSIKASIDLKQFDILYTPDSTEPVSINITPSLPATIISDMYEIENFYPTTAKLNIDSIITVNREVSIIQTGDIASGHIASEPTCDPETVNITGASSKINTINQICAYINVENADDNLYRTSDVYVSDDNGQTLNDIRIEPSAVDISMKINKQGQLRVAVPHFTGTPADGYEFSEIVYEPKFVEVLGNSIETKELKLPDIDITGLKGDKTFEFNARDYIKDTNLTLKNTNAKIKVTAKIIRHTSVDVNIPSSQFEITGYDSSLYDVSADDYISVTLKGTPDKIESLNTSQIKVKINLSGLSAGSHSVQAELELPNGINADSDVSAIVTITEKKKSDSILPSAITPPLPETEETTAEVFEETKESTTSQTEDISEEVTQ